MSKEAATRAMREARYAAQQARTAGAPTRRPPVAPPASPAGIPAEAGAKKAPAPRTNSAETDDASSPALCGHRSMNGRTCTREQGHAAKNHRYS